MVSLLHFHLISTPSDLVPLLYPPSARHLLHQRVHCSPPRLPRHFWSSPRPSTDDLRSLLMGMARSQDCRHVELYRLCESSFSDQFSPTSNCSDLSPSCNVNRSAGVRSTRSLVRRPSGSSPTTISRMPWELWSSRSSLVSSNASRSLLPTLTSLSFLPVVLGLFGYKWVHVYERYSWIPTAITFIGESCSLSSRSVFFVADLASFPLSLSPPRMWC